MESLESLFYSSIISKNIDKYIKITKEEDIKNLPNNVNAKYELLRGNVTSNIVADLSELKGVEDLGDSIKVLAGTKWRDVISYSPELWSVMDFSVGGTISLGDEGFGYNEFGELANRVTVEAYLNGEKYTGKYRGGIIYAIYIKKENKPLIFKQYSGSEDIVLSKVKSLLSENVLPFRDISLIKDNNGTRLVVSYTQVREILVRRYISGFSEAPHLYPQLSSIGKFIYIGKTDLLNISSDLLKNTKYAYFTFRGNSAYYVVSSDIKLDITSISQEYSIEKFNGCILCGKCVDTCPHSYQRNSPVFSPLGFFVLSTIGKETYVSNCHLCGICEEVCPVDLNIVDLIKQKSTLNSKVPNVQLTFPSKKSIILTAISDNLLEDALKLIKYFSLRGIKLGVITLPEPLEKIVKGQINLENARKLLENVDEIITLTPEEARYLIVLKSVKILDITFAYSILENIIRPLMEGKRIHFPCFYSEKEFYGCSYEMLNLANNEGYGENKINAEITLCPLAAKRLGIKSYIDLLNINLDISDVYKLHTEISETLSTLDRVLEDAEWYKEIEPKIYEKIFLDAIDKVLLSKNYFEIFYYYLNIDKLEFKNERIKSSVKNEIEKLLRSSNKD
ncbi:4Fe-4S dicluster domain-containing protein [Acidianus infernus]|uniref:4Fe-4S dicluster domain-containing protein n=1 Tax=Acidianus infernus TaxID=12915 RepID=A0A6A9QHD8_ACIIN|nr:4Fe-4S dicluster domain-containing protein [Acidianus infernus]MUM65233.1 4Fe-4S dicluster domain-containing protein [Acidianus infernus]